jgi:predicted metal-dependent hydrolase
MPTRGTAMADIPDSRIVRSRRRTLALVITRDARLEVRAPLHAPAEFIEAFIARKSSWINRHIAEAFRRLPPPAKRFVPGEEFLYLGSSYPLAIIDNADVPLSFDQKFFMARRDEANAKELFMTWYRQRATVIIKERLDLCAALHRIAYDRFKVTGARCRWASCAGNGRLSFSWRLVMAPLHVIDYVVAHELAHIGRKDHSKHFWNSVGELCPRYNESAKWLKDNGHFLAGII